MGVFKLAQSYTLYAADELACVAAELQELARKGGAVELRTELERRARSRELVHRNSWQTATYFALAQSEWFLAEGVTLI